jgi:hypothetical protein
LERGAAVNVFIVKASFDLGQLFGLRSLRKENQGKAEIGAAKEMREAH